MPQDDSSLDFDIFKNARRNFSHKHGAHTILPDIKILLFVFVPYDKTCIV